MRRSWPQNTASSQDRQLSDDKPAHILTRGRRSDRTPVQVLIEPRFTYRFMCDEYSEKLRQWCLENNISPTSACSHLQYMPALQDVTKTRDYTCSEMKSEKKATETVPSSSFESLLQRLKAANPLRTKSRQSMDAVWRRYVSCINLMSYLVLKWPRGPFSFILWLPVQTI